MATDKRQFTMRMQQENFDKIRVIAALNKRSVAMQIEYLLEHCIAAYEAKNGKIKLEPSDTGKVGVVQNNVMGNNVIGNNTLIAVDDGKSYVSIT